jgi:hypothetical protein
VPPARLGARRPRHRPGDTVAMMAANTPAMLRGALRRAHVRRRAQHNQHPPRRRGHRLHSRPRRSQGADHRSRVRRRVIGGAGGRRPSHPGDRHRRSEVARPGIGEIDYEALLAAAIRRSPGRLPADEWNAISLNYTSGTTGNPKGVVYHHRGAYLLASATWSRASMASTRSICGPCRCSTATAGASLVPGGRRRHPCLPPQVMRQGDLRRHRRPRGHPFVRRADRHGNAGHQRHGRRAPPVRPRRVRLMTAAAPPPAGDAGRHGAPGFASPMSTD